MHKVIERILNLLAFLLTVGRPVTADEIRHTVAGYDQPSDEAFRRTFERDKDLLRSLGVPLRTTPTDIWEVELGYVVPSDEYVLEDPGFTDQERSALLLAAETVRFGGQQTDLAAIFKLGGAADALPTGPVSADLGHDLESLGTLFEAVNDRHRTRFEYRGRARRVAPYGLVHRFGHWYLVGPESVDTELVKVYRVDRMSSITVEDDRDAFVRPSDFDPAAVLSDLQAPRADHLATALLDNDIAGVAMARWRAARILSADEERTLVEVPYDDAAAVINWVLGFDDRAVIMTPSSLRDRFLTFVGGSP
jgi:proteasome accessory factor B